MLQLLFPRRVPSWVCSAVLAVSFVSVPVHAKDSVKAETRLYLDAWQQKAPWPLVSKRWPSIRMDQVYGIQSGYVKARLKDDKIRGFKGGLTNEDMYKKFALKEPVVGVLFGSGEIPRAPESGLVTVRRSQFLKLVMETEIGFVFAGPITKKVKDVDTLKTLVRGVVPAVELPDIEFANNKKMRGIDLVASDVAVKQYVFGNEADKNLPLDSIEVTVHTNGQMVSKGKGSDAMGGQWKAALWQVNKLISLGYTIEPGQVLITGILGHMVPGEAGDYAINYGPLGQLQLHVVDGG